MNINYVGNNFNYLYKEIEGHSNGTCSRVILMEGAEAVKTAPHGH